MGVLETLLDKAALVQGSMDDADAAHAANKARLRAEWLETLRDIRDAAGMEADELGVLVRVNLLDKTIDGKPVKEFEREKADSDRQLLGAAGEAAGDGAATGEGALGDSSAG